MSTITTRKSHTGSITHTVRVRLKGHPQTNKTFRRLTDAREWASRTESAIRERRYFRTRESERRTVADLLDRYRDEIREDAKKVAAGRLRHVDWWRGELGYLILADLTSAHVVELRERLGKEVTVRGARRAPATVNRYLATFSHALSMAVREWGWLTDSPMRHVRKKSEPMGRVRFLDDAERQALLAACEASGNPNICDVVVLALSTGMRQDEIMSLHWQDIDFTRGRITLQNTKNGERRGVPLVGHPLERLLARSKVRHIKSALVFPSRLGDGPASIRKSWEAAVREAGLADFRFHDLRHSAASYLAMQGASPVELAEILGHKSLSMVKRYAHLAEGHTRRLIEQMSDGIFSR